MIQRCASDVAGSAPLGKFYYTLLFWCPFVMLFNGYDLVTYDSVVPQLMEYWVSTLVIAGWMDSAALFGMMFGAVIIGPLADRLGRRKIILNAMTLASACTLGIAWAWDAESFAALRFVTGVGLGGAIPNIVALMNDLIPKACRSRMTTIMLSFYSTGVIFSALAAMFTIPHFGQEATFLVGGIPLLFLPRMHHQLPESLNFLLKKDKIAASAPLKRIDPAVNADQVRFDASVRTSSEAPLLCLFTEGCGVGTVFLWLGFGMCMLIVCGLSTRLPKIMVAGGFPLGSSLMFLVILNIGVIFGALGSGWLADRRGCKPMLILLFLPVVISFCMLGIRPGPLLLSTVLLITDVTTIGTLAIIHVFAAQQYPSEIRAAGVSWCSVIGCFGAVVGPAMGGLMLSINLPLQFNSILCAVPGLVAILATVMIKRRDVVSVGLNAQPADTRY